MDPRACCLLLCAATVSAQNVTQTALTASPLTLTCAIPGVPPQVAVVGAGAPVDPILLQPSLSSPAGTASATIDGELLVDDQYVEMTSIERATASLGGSVTLPPHDYVLTVQAAVPTPVELRVTWIMTRDPGQPLPLAQVDIGDDAIFDFQGIATGQSMTVPLVLDATPLRIRTRTAIGALQGHAEATLACSFRSRFGLTWSTPASPGCNWFVLPYTNLEHELVLTMPWSPATVSLMVIGLTAVAVPLPLPTTCVLGASPDIVVPPVPFGDVRVSLLTAPPGPFTFFAQGWTLLPASNYASATSTTQLHLP